MVSLPNRSGTRWRCSLRQHRKVDPLSACTSAARRRSRVTSLSRRAASAPPPRRSRHWPTTVTLGKLVAQRGHLDVSGGGETRLHHHQARLGAPAVLRIADDDLDPRLPPGPAVALERHRQRLALGQGIVTRTFCPCSAICSGVKSTAAASATTGTTALHPRPERRPAARSSPRRLGAGCRRGQAGNLLGPDGGAGIGFGHRGRRLACHGHRHGGAGKHVATGHGHVVHAAGKLGQVQHLTGGQVRQPLPTMPSSSPATTASRWARAESSAACWPLVSGGRRVSPRRRIASPSASCRSAVSSGSGGLRLRGRQLTLALEMALSASRISTGEARTPPARFSSARAAWIA